MNKSIKYLSLFSGIEAATVACKGLGWECVAVSEIDPFPCAVLAHHYPTVPNLGDITKITEQQIQKLGQIDLIVFGSPCQNLSVAGNRKGLQGESSGLFYEAIRLISYARKHCNTRFALWENVTGAFSSNKGDDFREVVKHMAGLNELNTPTNGWGKEGAAVGSNGLLEWCVLDAQWFGLAQRRKRVFAIVDFGNWQDRQPILLERESLRGNTPPSREAWKKTTTGNEISTAREGGFGGFVDSRVAGTLKANGDTLSGGSETLVVERPVFFAEPRRSRAVDVIADNEPCVTLSAMGGTGGGNLPMVIHATQDPIVSNNLSHAIGQNGGQENAVLNNATIRRLTPRECERLMGFPDDYTKIPYRNKTADECPDSPRYKALGNSKAVPVVKWIFEQIAFVVGGDE